MLHAFCEECRKHVAYRDVAQVVARVVRDHEAAGSNPVIPSMKHSDYVGVLHVETPCVETPFY